MFYRITIRINVHFEEEVHGEYFEMVGSQGKERDYYKDMHYFIDKFMDLDKLEEEEMNNIKRIIQAHTGQTTQQQSYVDNYQPLKGDNVFLLIDSILAKLEPFLMDNKIKTFSYFKKDEQFHIIRIKVLDGNGKFRIYFL
jgi:hypothetical protein